MLAPVWVAAAQSTDVHTELRAMSQADQADRKTRFDKVPAEELQKIAERDTKRLERVKVLLKQGKLETPEDFDNASLLFQHGTSVNDYLTAHELGFIRLLKAKRTADNIIVLSEDRFLQRIARRQRFGTQGSYGAEAERLVAEPVDETGPFAVTDTLRADLFLPTLTLYKQHGPVLPTSAFEPVMERIKLHYDAQWLVSAAKSPESKDLAALGAKRAVTAAQRDKVLQYYYADKLRTPDDFKNAATVLLLAADTTHLDSEQEAQAYLLAHELAIVAAVRGKSAEATRLVAMTMDRFLIRIGLSPRYATGDDDDKSEAIEPASNSVRQALGI